MRLASRDQLTNFLNRLLQSYGTYERFPVGVLKNALQGHMEVEVEVDQWPDLTTYILKVKQDQDVPVYMKKWLYVHSDKPSQLDALVRKPEVLDWSKSWDFMLSSEIAGQVVANAAKEKCGTYRLGKQGTYVYDINVDKDTPFGILPNGYTHASLTVSQAKMVNDIWESSEGDLSEDYIRYCIQRFPSTCIYDPHGAPVAWNLTWHCMAMAMAHVVPHERGKRWAASIGALTALKTMKVTDTVYAYINEFNEASIRSTRGGVAKRLPGKIFWVYYEAPPSPPGSKL